jgi:uncharacterized membrane protein
MTVLKIYAAGFFSIIALDFIWLGFITQSFYVEQLRPIGRIAGDKFDPVLWAAAVVYIALTLGVVHLALPQLNQDSSWLATFAVGALLGFVVYGTYDFTNHSTLNHWPLALVAVDVSWGSFLCGTVTMICRYVRDL